MGKGGGGGNLNLQGNCSLLPDTQYNPVVFFSGLDLESDINQTGIILGHDHSSTMPTIVAHLLILLVMHHHHVNLNDVNYY